MLTVYRVVPDLDKYQYILADDAKTAMKSRFDGAPIADDWEQPSSYRANPKKPKPDFWGCFTNPAVFAVTEAAAPRIVSFLDQSCEPLPLESDGQKLLLCNITCVVNALDINLSRHKDGLPHWIEEYVFHPNRFEYSLFKIPETAMSEILCVEGLAAPEDEFKGTVEKHGLKGLKFKEIWRGG